jgi:hypothetical protein
MEIKRLLLEKKPVILQKWFDSIVETYPTDTATFLKGQKDRFANPVGYTISEGINEIFDSFFEQENTSRVSSFLDNIIRIRAVQGFSPSEALNFMFLLKRVIREELTKDIHTYQMFEELLFFESRIDELIRLSFDIYMKCREKLYELKANETRNLTYRILEKTGMLKELSPEQNINNI